MVEWLYSNEFYKLYKIISHSGIPIMCSIDKSGFNKITVLARDFNEIFSMIDYKDKDDYNYIWLCQEELKLAEFKSHEDCLRYLFENIVFH